MVRPQGPKWQQVLPRHRTEYVATDVAGPALAAIRARVTDAPFVEVRPFDLDRDPGEQGSDGPAGRRRGVDRLLDAIDAGTPASAIDEWFLMPDVMLAELLAIDDEIGPCRQQLPALNTGTDTMLEVEG